MDVILKLCRKNMRFGFQIEDIRIEMLSKTDKLSKIQKLSFIQKYLNF